MTGQSEVVWTSIIRDMSEGVMVLGMDGRIEHVNPAAEDILQRNAQTLMGKGFAAAFFEYSENDSFNQLILDAIYDASSKHYRLVPYYTGSETRQLYVLTSFLRTDEKKIGVIVVLNDVTELAELKIRYAEQITILLDSLVKALSTAIDERSPYNANHTRNMVRMGEAFLDWLERTGHPWTFDEEKRRAFLMSVWLHDVGKLAVPLEVMDKSTRLGERLSVIEQRFETMSLLDRIAALEGRIDAAERARRDTERETTLAFVRRINSAGFLPDADLAAVEALRQKTYVDAAGAVCPWFTGEELTSLSIRRGTLTDEERTIMQSHAEVTGRILGQVDFPESYASVPVWAASHHEFLSGGGYPNKLTDEAIPAEVRLLTILDVFEALTAKDRPYKSPMPLEKAEAILRSMVEEGSVDGGILALFEESRAWEAIL